MTAEHDPRTRTVLSWLREDAHENAERALLLALDEVDTTPQRRSRWPARRSMAMNRFSIAAVAAAAVVAVAIVGYNLVAAPDVGRQPTAGPTTTTTPDASEAPRLPDGSLTAGTYGVQPFPATTSAGLQFTMTVPSGWQGIGNGVAADAGTAAPGAAVVFLLPKELFLDPCKDNAVGSPVLSAGTTVDDLVNALREMGTASRERFAPYVVGAAVDTTIDGYEGKQVDLIAPSQLDFATCTDGQFWIWDAGPYAQGPGNHWHIWILDVAGTRVVILGEDFPTTPSAVHRQLRDIVASIRVLP
jgi:hypothetical protein